MNVLIIDEDDRIIDELVCCIQKECNEVSIDIFHSFVHLELLKNHYDMIIIDMLLQTKYEDEYKMLKRKYSSKTKYILMSYYPELLFDVVKRVPYFFIRKANLKKDVNTLFDIYKESMGDSVKIKGSIDNRDYRIFNLNLDDILYIEAQEKAVEIHTMNETIIVKNSLKEIESVIGSEYIVRIHRTYIVNLNHVTNYKYYRIYLDNQLSVPVGRTYRHYIKDKLKEYDVSYLA